MGEVTDCMADKENAARPTKRRVKNPETFREKVLKAADESVKPPRRSRLKGRTKFLLRPLGKAFRAIAKFPPFRFLRKPLHIIGLIIFPKYFRNSWRELRLVTWPTFKQSLRLTWAVLLFAIIFGVVIAIVDAGLQAVFKNVLLKY